MYIKCKWFLFKVINKRKVYWSPKREEKEKGKKKKKSIKLKEIRQVVLVNNYKGRLCIIIIIISMLEGILKELVKYPSFLIRNVFNMASNTYQRSLWLSFFHIPHLKWKYIPPTYSSTHTHPLKPTLHSNFEMNPKYI